MKNIHIYLILISLCTSFSCAQSTSSNKKEPTFSLSFKVENIILTTKTEEPTTQNTPLLIKEPLSLKNNFNDKDPIILSLKGYKQNKVHDLAWGKSSISTEIIKQTTKKPIKIGGIAEMYNLER